MRRLLLVLVFGVSLPAALLAQSSEVERRLDLKRAELAEGQAKASYEQTKHLFDQGIESRFALDKAQADLLRAGLETVRARAALANELPSVRIVSAVKSSSPAGETLVDLEVQELERSLDPEIQRRYLVSLTDANTIISDPYEAPLSFVGPKSATKRVRFRLLKDLDSVTVLVNSGARKESIPIVLQRSVTANRVQLTTPTFSQDGTLGDQVDYAITIERFARDAAEIELVVDGLPDGFEYDWIDVQSNAKVRRVRFRDGVDSLKVLLRVHLPEEANPAWFGQVLSFKAIALKAGARGTEWGNVVLQLRPVGSPKLAVKASNLLVDITPRSSTRVPIDVENTGAAEARGVQLEADFPLGFQGQFSPASLPVLRPRERKTVSMLLRATEDAVPGEYTLKMKATTAARNMISDSPEISFRIALKDLGSTLWTSSAIAVLFGAIAVVVILVSRKVRK